MQLDKLAQIVNSLDVLTSINIQTILELSLNCNASHYKTELFIEDIGLFIFIQCFWLPLMDVVFLETFILN